MKKTAFIFPGQGSQYVGMAKDLYEEFLYVREMFEKASNILKFDLSQICFEGPTEKLKETACTQPAIFLHSCALDMILKEHGIRPDVAAGHSLGEYSALVCSEALDFECGLLAVAKRSSAMQRDCEENSGLMAAVIGIDLEDAFEVTKSIEGTVVPANYNTCGQVVISGEKEAVEQACQKLKESQNIKTVGLSVAGAYHSPLMQRSSEIMKEFILSEIHLNGFKRPVYSNVSAKSIEDGESFKALLIQQITSPVLWYPTLLNMHQDGVRRFVEVGPGKVLQGLVKRSLQDPEIEIYAVDNLDQLDEFINECGKIK
jgi:[acyl-carrier-protein] S-malonyltransferase